MNSAPVKKIATVLGAGSLLLGAVVAAPGASAAPAVAAVSAPLAGDSSQAVGARTALVNAWFQQFLGRSALDDPASGYWVVRLRTEAPAAVLTDLLRTREHVVGEVAGYYQGYLGRGLDPGASYWVDGVVSGAFPLEWAEQNILASPEYLQQRVPVNADLDPVVQGWYADILGRQASPGEVGYWLGRLFSTGSLLEVVREIWYTSEGVGVRVASHYEDYLQRPADGGEVAYWSDAEVASDVGVVIAIAIASSAEYREKTSTFLPAPPQPAAPRARG